MPFNFFGPKAPVICHSNPGRGAELKLATDTGAMIEHVKLVELLAAVLEEKGYKVKKQASWLEHQESGYLLSPSIVDVVGLEDGSFRTVSTIQINHPKLAPAGVFEYQHSMEITVGESMTKGFDYWVQTDWILLLDALKKAPESCTIWEMSFPAKDGKPERVRRAIFGPIMQLVTQPESKPAKDESEDEHDFCPCCLFTKSLDYFQELVEAEELCCLRLFAAREDDGSSAADCRVNGDDYLPGFEGLRAYAQTWEGSGYEFRKQYVILIDPNKLN